MDTLPNVNGHALVFDSATVSTSYNLEGAATVTAVFQVAGVSVTAGGSGYLVGDVVNLVTPPSATGSGATATVSAVDANGAITAVTVTAAGSQYSLPPILSVTSVKGTGALLNVSLGAGTLTGITVTDTGGAYTRAPTATIDAPPAGGTQATALVTVKNGLITSITLVNKGSGYTSIPNVTFSGGGKRPNPVDNGAVGLTASNSIFSDAINAGNVFGSNNVVPTAPAGGAGLLVGQYCNGARVPPEQCTGQQGANNQGMCLGYFTPAGISENVGIPQVFRFKNIAATATVDEGNNWINMTYGPLTLSRPTTSATPAPTAQEQMVSVPAVGSTLGAYSIPATSAAVDAGNNTAAPKTDFFGNTRPLTATNPADIGAVEYQPAAVSATLAPGTWTVAQTRNCPGVTILDQLSCLLLDPVQVFTLTNTGNVALTGVTQGALAGPDASEFNILLSSCGIANVTTTLAPGASCSIAVQFQPLTSQSTGTKTATLSITDSVGTQTVTLNGTAL
jgi:hypothetical protein